jgi:hypothetical protein
VDIYNLFNGNTLLLSNPAYGTNGAAWLRPVTILPARMGKVSVQFTF